jgi:peptidoglycan/xylan/chitin deacetylase (PgdA/CDA1 family)
VRRRIAVLTLSCLISLPLLGDETPVATILCYHEVDAPDTSHDTIPRRSAHDDSATEQRRYTCTPSNFEAQLDYLTANDYHVIPLATLVDYLDGAVAEIPARAVVITVDDGWACASSEIFDAMRRRNLPWTLFVYPKIVGRGSHAVTWRELQELAECGVDIESHTLTHPFLTLKNNPAVSPASYDEFLEHELRESRLRLEQTIGKEVRFLCYPYGDYDDAVAAAAQAHGYEAAVTTERGPITRSTPPMRLKRYLIHNDTTLAEFATFLVR